MLMNSTRFFCLPVVLLAALALAMIRPAGAEAASAPPFSQHMLSGLAKAYGLTFELVSQKPAVSLKSAETTAVTKMPARGKPLATKVAIVHVTGQRYAMRGGSPQHRLCWVLAYPYTNRILYAVIDARTNHSYGGFVSTVTR